MVRFQLNDVEYSPDSIDSIPDPVVREKVRRAVNTEKYYEESNKQLLAKRNSTECTEKREAAMKQLEDTQVMTKCAYKAIKEDLRKNHNAEIQSDFLYFDTEESRV